MAKPTDVAVDCSVLVPVLNEERYIEQSVAAMQRQRFLGRIEFLFADGGSPTARARFSTSSPAAIRGSGSSTTPTGACQAASTSRSATRGGAGRCEWMPTPSTRPTTSPTGVARLQRDGTRWVSGPQVPKGHGPVSRAVALALAITARPRWIA